MAGVPTVQFAQTAGLPKGMTLEYVDKITGSHTGAGDQTFALTFSKGTNRVVKEIAIAAPNMIAGEYVNIYNGSVAAGNLVGTGYLYPGAVFKFNNLPQTTVFNVVINSSTASTVYINVQYAYDA